MLDNKQVYKAYCEALAKASGLKGQQLSDHIAEANRRCYKVVFGSREIRQRDMTDEQLTKLSLHRQLMTSLMQ